MKKRHVTKCMSLVLLSVLILTACASGGSSKANKNNDTGSSGTSGQQEFRVAVPQEMPSADLSVATDTISFSALNNVYEGLYRLDQDSKPQVAGAAEKAEISEDQLTYKIKLRKDAQWSNGDPVVAADYVYGWQRTANPKTAAEYAYLYELVKNGAAVTAGEKSVEELGIKAVDEYELEITLEKPTPYFDYLLAFPSFFPQHQETVETYGKDYARNSDSAVYNGPFILADFDGPGSDTNWSYLKNDTYWDKDSVKLDKIAVDVVKESPTALNMFQNDQVDDVILIGELAQQMAGEPEFVSQKEGRTVYMEVNQRDENSPYRNENLRKAFSYAIDRDALINKILGDGSVISTGLVPSELAFSPTDDKDFSEENKNVLAYDADKAKEYWEKAKKELGIETLEMDILHDDMDSTKKVTEYIQGVLNETLDGIKVTVTPVPFTVRLDRSNNGEFEAVMSGWGADYADPSSFLDLFVTGNSYNRGRYTNQKYDDLLKASSTTNAGNPEARWEDMVAAEKLLMDEMGVMPLYQKAEAHMRNTKIKGVVAHTAGAQYDYKWTYIEE